MKGIDFICASQASTSICLSQRNIMDVPSSSSTQPEPLQLGGRAIDRHNPIICDSRRLSFRATITPTLSAPCSSSQPLPINPTPYHQLQNSKNTAPVIPSPKPGPASEPAEKLSSKSPLKKKNKKKNSSSRSFFHVKQTENNPNHGAATARKSSVTLTDFITPPGSSRYLLGESGKFDGLPDYNDPVLAFVPVPEKAIQLHKLDKDDKFSVLAAAPKLSSSSRFNKPSSDQVVVLRVSLHCKGCAEKLRKHLSRMEGVTSFNIDFAAKKVTISGNVTPLSVLASVSKVKNAQFWTSAPSIVSVHTSDNKK